MTGPTPSAHQRNVDALAATVKVELANEWARKSGYEGRAFAMFTLDLGVASLYLLAREQFGLTAIVNGSPAQIALWVSLILIAVSTLLAIGGAMPGRYPGLAVTGLRSLNSNLATSTRDYPQRILETELQVLEDVIRRNNLRATAIAVSFVLSGIAVVGFTTTLILNAVGLAD